MSKSSPQDRRTWLRVPFVSSADLRVCGRRVRAHGVDISPTGLGLWVPRDVPVGEYLRLELALFDEQGRRRRHMVDGVVAHSEMVALETQLGIQFAVIDGMTLGEIHRHVRRHVDFEPPKVETGRYGIRPEDLAIGKSVRVTGISGRPCRVPAVRERPLPPPPHPDCARLSSEMAIVLRLPAGRPG